MIKASWLTRASLWLVVVIVAATSAFLLVSYRALPDLLPVHFRRNGLPNGWQYKTYGRVLMPVIVQAALAAAFGGIAALLLSRPLSVARRPGLGSSGEADVIIGAPAIAPDAKAAVTAAEAVSLIALIWVGFQGYASVALVAMWTAGRAGLGSWYTYLQAMGLGLTAVVAVRAHFGLGRPDPRPYVAEHWCFGQLYRNSSDPALFVPTRDGSRWTLNFGRPVAAALLGLILLFGLLGPAVLLALALR